MPVADTVLSPLAWLMATQFLLYALGWGLCSLLLREQRAPVAHWAAFMLLLGAGSLLTTLRGEPRSWWAYPGANLCFAIAFILLRRGMERFMGVVPRDAEHALTALAFVALFVAVGADQAQAPVRVLLAYGTCIWVLLRTLQSLQASLRAEYGGRIALLLSAPLLAVVATFGARLLQQALDMGHSQEMHRFTQANVGSLYAYVSLAAMYNFGFVALLTLRFVRRLRHLLQHDPLTGLPNRRALEAELEREWQRFARNRRPFAVLALDLDHFKQVNDRHGHLAGDEVLAEVARRLRGALRGCDLVARTGGEEFVALLPDTDVIGASLVAERLRRRIAEQPMPVSGPAGGLPMTVSLGLAEAGPHDADLRGVLLRADEALYAAKARGRDRVELAEAPARPGGSAQAAEA
jgi:diguanylate cyclase (GGDEF)-like protein